MSITKKAQQIQKQYLLKLIIIGDSGVGKTNILVRFCENQFKSNYIATIGVDFKIKTIQINKNRLKYQIWDTAGQQRYKNIAQTYYKGAHGIILTYAINDEKSFQNIQKWMIQINQHAPKDVIKVLVANKSDIENQRLVQKIEGQVLAKKYNIPFMEVSAKSGTNIREIFQKLGEIAINEVLPNMTDDRLNTRISSYTLKDSEDSKIKKSCC